MNNTTDSAARAYSTTGRPRRLTDSQIAEILEWHQSRITNSEMAERYGIARGTLENIIRTSGRHYKQASPSSGTRRAICNVHAARGSSPSTCFRATHFVRPRCAAGVTALTAGARAAPVPERTVQSAPRRSAGGTRP